MCGSPELFAAYRGLPRLRVPRHPPYAFARLTTLPVKQSTRDLLCAVARHGSHAHRTSTSELFLSMPRPNGPDIDRETVSRVLIHDRHTQSTPSAPPNDDAHRTTAWANPTITTSIRCQTANTNITNSQPAPTSGASWHYRESRLRSGVEASDTRAVFVGDGEVRRLLAGSVKEVIQPQVPLRLPCYDFAPVTALAFGRLAPCGFRHGLRALTASMA